MFFFLPLFFLISNINIRNKCNNWINNNSNIHNIKFKHEHNKFKRKNKKHTNNNSKCVNLSSRDSNGVICV